MTEAQASWSETESILTSRLSGAVLVAHVEQWKRALDQAIEAIPANRRFKFLFDLHGYEPVERMAHRAMRSVVPVLLSTHGLRAALLDLFDEKPEIPLTVTDGKLCVAVAHLHHDADGMSSYEAQIAKPNQRFFSDPSAAKAWLRSL